jgi:uncharacterized protein YggU (UPF0235/DUF167 family)
MARRSATECAAIVDFALRMKLAEPASAGEANALLVRVVQMLTKLAKRFDISAKDGNGDGRRETATGIGLRPGPGPGHEGAR